jgi:hypothetical protein
VLAGENIRLVLDGSLSRLEAGSVHTRAGPDSDEGKVRPLPRQNLVVGDPDVLSQGLQLLVADQCLVDQTRKLRIIEKLFYRDLR